MSAILLLLMAFPYGTEDPLPPELVLKGQYRIGPASATGIIPLGKRYLCFGDGYRSFGNVEIKIFDRQSKKIVFSMNTPMERVYALARNKNFIYALDVHRVFRIPISDGKQNALPVLGPAQEVDIHGEKASELLYTDTTTGFRTDSFSTKTYKVYMLENGVANKEKVIDISKLTPEMIAENEDALKSIYIKFISINAKSKLAVANTHRLRIYDLDTMRLEGDFRYEPMYTHPKDLVCCEGKFVLVFWGGKLRVIDSDGKITDHKISDGYLSVHYIQSSKVYVLTTADSIAVMTTIGKIEKSYRPPTCIGSITGLRNMYVDEKYVFLGIDSYDRQDNYVGGGDLLEFEIKVNRR